MVMKFAYMLLFHMLSVHHVQEVSRARMLKLVVLIRLALMRIRAKERN